MPTNLLAPLCLAIWPAPPPTGAHPFQLVVGPSWKQALGIKLDCLLPAPAVEQAQDPYICCSQQPLQGVVGWNRICLFQSIMPIHHHCRTTFFGCGSSKLFSKAEHQSSFPFPFPKELHPWSQMRPLPFPKVV